MAEILYYWQQCEHTQGARNGVFWGSLPSGVWDCPHKCQRKKHEEVMAALCGPMGRVIAC